MAYNVRHTRENGEPFHPKGVGNGYLLSYGGKRIYVAGDTEDIPEMSELAGLDAAFLPANLPYTMDADMFMNAVEMLRPGRVYPYHYKFGKSVLSEVLPRLKEKKVPYKIAGDSV
jgi:L-ascorbate metabolism protein UlaG (beta-lactamase superfamily)